MSIVPLIFTLVGMLDDIRAGFIDCRLDGINGRVVKTGLGRLVGDEVTYFFQVLIAAWKNAVFRLQGCVVLEASDCAYRIVIES